MITWSAIFRKPFRQLHSVLATIFHKNAVNIFGLFFNANESRAKVATFLFQRIVGGATPVRTSTIHFSLAF